jgi:taurine dioxygenase
MLHAARQFGNVLPAQLSKFALPECPEVGTLSSRDLPLVDGKLHVRGENYHTDHSNFSAPPKGTMVQAMAIPSKGGDTQFVDVRRAYDDLPEATKAKIAGLKSLHAYHSSDSPRPMVELTPEERETMPETIQPLVVRHPDSDRAAIYLNTGRMEGIEGMERSAANALIAELFAHATQAKYEYRHVWKKGDLVLWDNRSVMHQANGDYDPDEYRLLYRVLVAGQPLQQFAENQSVLETAK